MKRTLSALAATLLAATLVTGCGGDPEPADTAGESVSESPTPEGDAAAGEEETPDVTEPAETDPAAPEDGSGDANAPGAGSEYCDLIGKDLTGLLSVFASPADIPGVMSTLDKVAEAAPDEVADDWSVISSALDKVSGSMQEAVELQEKAAAGTMTDAELRKEGARLMEEMKAIDTPENRAAGDAVSKHAQEHCGTKLGMP
jgi:hypothetical protein